MAANVIEGIILQPKIPGEQLAKKDEKKIVGEFTDAKGRLLIVFPGEAGRPTQYMIYWNPKNPAAPISRGSVLQNEKSELVFYQPGDPNVVKLTYSGDKSNVESVVFTNPVLRFERSDSEAR